MICLPLNVVSKITHSSEHCRNAHNLNVLFFFHQRVMRNSLLRTLVIETNTCNDETEGINLPLSPTSTPNKETRFSWPICWLLVMKAEMLALLLDPKGWMWGEPETWISSPMKKNAFYSTYEMLRRPWFDWFRYLLFKLYLVRGNSLGKPNFANECSLKS